ncbi:MAG: hypothetical protein Q4G58_07500 [bacterium]|nr:hypothetical protein [bacterium]
MNRDLLLLIHLMNTNRHTVNQASTYATDKCPMVYDASSKLQVKQIIADTLRGIANLLDPVQIAGKQTNI